MKDTRKYKVLVEVDVDALNKEEAEEIVHEFVRECGLTWDECDFLFDDRLTHVQCNVVTTESVAALTTTRQED